MLVLSHSCAAVVLWVRAVYSDCLLLLPAAQIRAGTLVARSTGLRQTSSTVTPPPRRGLLDHPSQCSQPWPVNAISIVTTQRASESSYFGSRHFSWTSAHVTQKLWGMESDCLLHQNLFTKSFTVTNVIHGASYPCLSAIVATPIAHRDQRAVGCSRT